MDKIVDTFKSGPFTFSLNYDHIKLSDSIIRAKVLFFTVREIPILPNLASQLEEELIRRSIFGTAAIEGNPLSEEAVKKILTEEEKKKATEKAEKQIQNLKRAYRLIQETPSSDVPFLLQEDLIKKMHAIITDGSEDEKNTPGEYRNHLVKVSNEEHGGIYTPPKILEDIKNLMKEYVSWINSPELINQDPVVRAALAHYYFALIHPFGDGNGRTARAMEAMMLKSAGFRFVYNMLSNFYYKHIDDYFWAFSLSERNKENSITPFLEFFLKGLLASLEEIRLRIFALIRKFTLKDYYVFLQKQKKITQRQYDLINLLLQLGKPFALKDLFDNEQLRLIYRNVTERTARRDLKNLTGQGLLEFDSDSSVYTLNSYVIG
ncbi:MAG: Fic family protein [Candidatus Omnitrophica bacterium]|nr:Fic family protein [Candidatus Omnitrophota bacterium]